MKPEAIAMQHAALDWTGIAHDVGDNFAARAAKHDSDGEFVAMNYADLRNSRLFSAGIPVELGGGGASHADARPPLRFDRALLRNAQPPRMRKRIQAYSG